MRTPSASTGSPEAARRLFAMSQPIERNLVETYLRNRGITVLHGTGSLRFQPRCYYRPDDHSPTETWPAMIASVTDLAGIDRRAPHLARSRRLYRGDARQGADRHAAAGDGRPSRSCCSIWRGGRGHGGRRGHRDDAVAPMRLADHADGRSPLGGASLRHPVPGYATATLHCPRRRSRRRRRDGDIDRPGAGGRDRGDRDLATARRLQRGSPPLGIDALWAASRVQIAAQDVAASWNWRHSRNGKRRFASGVATGPAVMLSLSVGDHAHGLLRGRSGSKRPGPATCGPTIFRRRRSRLYIARQNSRPPRSSAEASALRCAAGASPFRPPPLSP